MIPFSRGRQFREIFGKWGKSMGLIPSRRQISCPDILPGPGRAGAGGYKNSSLLASVGQKTKYLRGRGNNHYNFLSWNRKPGHPLPASYWGIVQWQDSGLWRR